MKTLLLAILIFTTASIFAQTNFRFADSTAQWNVLREIQQTGSEVTYIFKANGDTIIDGKQYQNILSPEDAGYYYQHQGNISVRRDSIGRVYRRAASDTLDILIYDFSKNAGDTVILSRYNPPWINSTFYLKVTAVDTVYLLGIKRKRMFLQDSSQVWIDGIGDLHYYFLSPVGEWGINDVPTYTTLCFFENGQLLYHDANFDTCVVNSITGVAELEPNSIKILPNPSSGSFITIQSDASFPTETKFQLFDIAGRMVLEKPLYDKIIRVELNGFSKGLYLYSIAANRQKISSGKLAVQ